nr:type II toxin-antitoxin system RelE/ParE family toxin [Leptospira adleri]
MRLKDDKKEFCSTRINKQEAIIFRFSQGHCFYVSIVDYH